MNVKLAQSQTEIEQCFPVMVQLRPHLTADSFLIQVKRQMEQGYLLAYIADQQICKAVAGFRLLEMLSRGRLLYVDDLVTDAQSRSQGYGEILLNWLVDYAKAHHCQSFNLDSGVHRADAHRFYFRQRLHIAAFHFARSLEES